MAKILLVEDDVGLSFTVCKWLEREHHTIELAEDGNSALEKLLSYGYDVVVLDWDLPEMSGINVLKAYRSKGGQTPILMLTGKSGLSDRLEGFNTGSDDYLTKPFELPELIVRIAALLRRSRTVSRTSITCGGVAIDLSARSVSVGETDISLTPREFALLEFFLRHPGETFSAEALMSRVWTDNTEGTYDAVTACVKRLRKKLEPHLEQPLIATVHGVGYKLVVEDH